MKWLASLPETCDTFTVTGGKGGRRTVEVTETSLPDEGDARQGLKVQLKGENEGTPRHPDPRRRRRPRRHRRLHRH